MEKKKAAYQAVNVSSAYLEKIKEHIKKYNYENIAHFVKTAIQNQLLLDTNGVRTVFDNFTEISPAEKKVTMANMQEQMISMQKEIEELKKKKK